MKLLLVFIVLGVAGQVKTTHPTRSAVVTGPDGLSGRKVSYVVETMESRGPLPMKLEIMRHGRVVRRIEGQPFVWRWEFQPDGKLVTYEAGPLHFGMKCVLENIETGEHIAEYDCFHEPLAPDAPQWVKELQALPD